MSTTRSEDQERTDLMPEDPREQARLALAEAGGHIFGDAGLDAPDALAALHDAVGYILEAIGGPEAER